MPFCSNCGAAIQDGSLFCNRCGANLSVQPQQATSTAASATTASVISIPLKQSWFSRHLNWTWVLGVLLFYVVQIFIGLIWGISKGLSGHSYYQSELDDLSFWGWLFPFLFIYLPVSGWVIKKKGRSLWFVLLSAFFFLPLWIANKSGK
jgi:hypothetical protein